MTPPGNKRTARAAFGLRFYCNEWGRSSFITLNVSTLGAADSGLDKRTPTPFISVAVRPVGCDARRGGRGSGFVTVNRAAGEERIGGGHDEQRSSVPKLMPPTITH